MKEKYVAFDGINGYYEAFETIEEAQSWLEEGFFDAEEGYHPDMKSCKIYELKQTVDYDVVDSKENYKYECEDDIPEDDEKSEAWPYDNRFDEIWKHKFVDVPKTKQNEKPT